eukprot:CAMPEP_0170539652 /NCGR_PEP_ID=MMETSP0209-20121228/104083_1 /TAXON_ID=665100 ORGANISM="Litonotus pictus, Strain P1" /NCGR_SAMPLE_ID=MMETSP0209 /ASSEMBLY_ACC=CAM_ASM_000301 /LENGTH=59 /DNA_ID=CAMNT_0010841671 /DNA_START=178 /DNA_END=357 /DNA_ORIENTATION=+
MSLKRYMKRSSSFAQGDFNYKMVINEKSVNGSDKSLQNKLSSSRMGVGKEYNELIDGKN